MKLCVYSNGFHQDLLGFRDYGKGVFKTAQTYSHRGRDDTCTTVAGDALC